MSYDSLSSNVTLKSQDEFSSLTKFLHKVEWTVTDSLGNPAEGKLKRELLKLVWPSSLKHKNRGK